MFAFFSRLIQKTLYCTRINDRTLPIIYNSRANQDDQVPIKDLIEHSRVNYRRRENEFSKKRYQKAHQNSVYFDVASAKKNIHYVKFNMEFKIDKYDFDKKGFPTSFKKDTLVPFYFGYAIAFNNADELGLIKIPKWKASRIEDDLFYGRKGVLRCFARVVKAQKQPQGDQYHRYVLYVDLIKCTLIHETSGVIVGRAVFS